MNTDFLITNLLAILIVIFFNGLYWLLSGRLWFRRLPQEIKVLIIAFAAEPLVFAQGLIIGLSLAESFLFLGALSLIFLLMAFSINVGGRIISGNAGLRVKRKDRIRRRIKKHEGRGRSAVQIQRRGFIPENDRLREYGFTDLELKQQGLLGEQTTSGDTRQ